MKKLLLVALVVLLAGNAHAQQWVFESMDNSVGSGFWDMGAFYDNGQGTSKMDLSDYTADKHEGSGSLKVDYAIGAGDGWGGYIVRVTPGPLPQFYDLSAGAEIRFWYKVLTPVTKTAEGSVFMEFKFGDYNDASRDLMYVETDLDFSDASGEWKEVVIPLVFTGDKTTGIAMQFPDGDGEMQLHKIGSFELAFVYITAGDPTNPPTASGSFLIDSYTLSGSGYTPIATFDDAVTTGFLTSTDNMSWTAEADRSSITLTDNTTDFVEGTSSLQLDYTVNTPFDWGGYLNLTKEMSKPDKFEERTALVMYVKNVAPHASTNPNRLSMRFFVVENSAGTDESWVCMVPIDWSKSSEWTRVYLPLEQKSAVDVGNDQKQFPSDGFAQPWWDEKGDKVFNPEAITAFKIELSAEGDSGPTGGGPRGEKLSGTILFDVIQQSGFKFSDVEAPTAVQGFLALQLTPGVTSIIWRDNDGEEKETYNIYYSKNPITDLTSSDVKELNSNYPEGEPNVNHFFYAPINDRSETYYYAINCKDRAGNVGPLSVYGPVEGVAKGIPTVRLTSPNFAADGSLAEWVAAGVKPFGVKFADQTAFLTKNDRIGGPGLTEDEDCSGECYVALDNQYLYVAFNMNDEVVFDDDSYYPGSTWQLDATELFMSFYDIDKTPLTKDYKGGKTPDYHLRFNKQKAREDHWFKETSELLLPGENYYWAEKFPAGYIVEARIPLVDLATKRDTITSTTLIDTIYVTRGMKIGFDWGVFDNDGDPTAKREARIFWSPFNQDHGYEDARLWMYTWLEDDQVVTDVPTETLPLSYSLSQNYPNPFNPATQITYSIQKAGMVSLKIYDILGRVVANLVNENKESGSYTVDFNASQLSSGVYFYKLESGSFTSVKKMMLVK